MAMPDESSLWVACADVRERLGYVTAALRDIRLYDDEGDEKQVLTEAKAKLADAVEIIKKRIQPDHEIE